MLGESLMPYLNFIWYYPYLTLHLEQMLHLSLMIPLFWTDVLHWPEIVLFNVGVYMNVHSCIYTPLLVTMYSGLCTHWLVSFGLSLCFVLVPCELVLATSNCSHVSCCCALAWPFLHLNLLPVVSWLHLVPCNICILCKPEPDLCLASPPCCTWLSC